LAANIHENRQIGAWFTFSEKVNQQLPVRTNNYRYYTTSTVLICWGLISGSLIHSSDELARRRTNFFELGQH
jgi:hypothetical protein